MMNCDELIELCKILAIEMIELSSVSESEYLMSTLMAFNDYVNGEEFSQLSSLKKDAESISLLCDMIQTLSNHLDRIRKKNMNTEKPRRMSLDEAKSELFSQYMNAMNSGDDSVAGMTIDEWMNDNSVKIVSPRGRRKKKNESQ